MSGAAHEARAAGTASVFHKFSIIHVFKIVNFELTDYLSNYSVYYLLMSPSFNLRYFEDFG
jgi:hypothetical protein